jgi:hypothetical protein
MVIIPSVSLENVKEKNVESAFPIHKISILDSTNHGSKIFWKKYVCIEHV